MVWGPKKNEWISGEYLLRKKIKDSVNNMQLYKMNIINNNLICSCSLSVLFVEDDTCSSHTGSNAHGGDTVFSLGSLHLREKCSNLSSTSASERMSDGNSTTLGVDFLHVEAKFLA